ncbi:SDR family NAD(P)-dependent oxidoreductase [Anaeromicropila populeti]|uniref:NAD(P)-dependent dehydrogenase, short-chain alcohol dehydrogenase family n=1 Tax=Anaeromicropila populeti TaxID=37658 RepID=A0A1I6HW49_9FIRM|nr:SDR family oxidoreductase [Anaeromicropila populeti]SFR58665.1 NAD(P)-dependent dehydrogenase, short-chain alcohol dehydrogenase family [Anaeromicropila populeti]
MSLKRKKIIVTAGCAGLGAVFTQYLLEQGAVVIPTSRSEKNVQSYREQLEPALQENCFPELLSLETQEEMDLFVNRIKGKYETVYGLVNCAVCRDTIYNAFELEMSQWEKHYKINVFANTYLSAQVIEKLMIQEGAVVNISSFYSVNIPDNRVYDKHMIPTSLVYASSKAAMNYITKYLAVHYAKNNVRVNAILAGGIRDKDRQNDYFYDQYCMRTPMNRMAEIGEFNEALRFCLAEENKFCTGQLISIDGGWGLY